MSGVRGNKAGRPARITPAVSRQLISPQRQRRPRWRMAPIGASLGAEHAIEEGNMAAARCRSRDRALSTNCRESGDHLLLADGPVNADAALLDLCAEAHTCSRMPSGRVASTTKLTRSAGVSIPLRSAKSVSAYGATTMKPSQKQSLSSLGSESCGR